MSGISTTNLPLSQVIDEFVGNRVEGSVRNTVRVPTQAITEGLADRIAENIAAAGGLGIFESASEGLSNTDSGQYFAVEGSGDDALILYRNVSGVAQEIGRTPSTAIMEGLASLSLVEDLIYVGTDQVYPLAINYRGELVAGLDRSSGRPVPDGGVSPQAAVSRIVLIREPDDLFICFPQPNGNYVRWRFNKRVRPENHCDTWQVRGVSEVTLTEETMLEVGQIVDEGQVELAFRRPTDGLSFLIGGWFHGRDEKLAEPTMLIDGVEFDITDPTPARLECERIEIFLAAQLLNPDDLSNFAKRYTRWVFARGELELSHHIEVEQQMDFVVMYLAMLPVIREGISHSLIRSPHYYPVEDVSGSHAGTRTDSSHLKVWGDRYGAEVEILEGWDMPGRESRSSPDNNRNKLYFDFTGEHTTEPGDVLSSRARLRVSVHPTGGQ